MVQKCLSEAPSIDAVLTKLVAALFFTVCFAMFNKHEAEKNTLFKDNMEERLVKLAKAVEEKRIKIEKGL